MAISENEQLVIDHLNLAWNEGEFSTLRGLVTPGFYYQTTFTDDILNLEQYIAFVDSFREAMPELEVTIEETMVSGDRVMSHTSFMGTLEKTIFGIPASDRIIAFPAISFWDIRHTKIACLNTMIDITGISRQVGIPIAPDMTLRGTK